MAADIHFTNALPDPAQTEKVVVVIDILGDVRTFVRNTDPATLESKWEQVKPLSIFPGWRITPELEVQTLAKPAGEPPVAAPEPVKQAAAPAPVAAAPKQGRIVDMSASGKVVGAVRIEATKQTINNAKKS